MPHNKELKLTKPSILELRSLTPVFCGRFEGRCQRIAVRREDALEGSSRYDVAAPLRSSVSVARCSGRHVLFNAGPARSKEGKRSAKPILS